MSEKKKVKVISVTGNGSFDSKYGNENGKMYVFEYVVDHEGTQATVQVNHKTTEPRFKEGDECFIEFTSKDNHGNQKAKLHKQDGSGGAGGGKGTRSGCKPKSIQELKNEQRVKSPSFALSYAKDFVTDVNIDKDDPADVAKTTVLVADVFLQWLNEKNEEINE